MLRIFRSGDYGAMQRRSAQALLRQDGSVSLNSHRTNIRVLHVIGSLGIGGTEKTMQLLATGMDRGRYSCFVFSHEDGERRGLVESQGVKVFVGGDLFACLGKIAPHVIHVHRAGWTDRKFMRSIVRYKAGQALPLVVETNVFGRYDASDDRQAIDMHLFVSRFCLERYLRDNAIAAPAGRHDVLYNPVDVSAFRECGTDKDPAGGRGPVVGRVSRPDPGKWSPLGWRFVPRVAQEFPDFRYRVIGVIDEALDHFRQSGVMGNVEIVPPLLRDQELAAFFDSVDVFAHANDTGESFGMTIAEAMAAGLPVVTHRCPGSRDNAQTELVEHGETGFVAEDEQSYAEHIIHLLKDRGLARRMGQKGRAKAAREFATPVVTQKLAAIYEALLAPKAARGKAG